MLQSEGASGSRFRSVAGYQSNSIINIMQLSTVASAKELRASGTNVFLSATAAITES